MLETKGQARLLNDLPQHRLAPGRKAFLQPIAPGHEIVNERAGAKGVSDRQGVRNDPGPLAAIGIGEPALVRIHPLAEAKIVEVAQDPVAGAGSQELGPAFGEATLDQQPVEAATMAEALQQAAEYFELDSGDLVAIQRDEYFTYPLE